MRRLVIALSALLVLFGATRADALAQTGDPRAVVQALVAAQNAGDVNAMLALLTDDAVVTAPSGKAFAGKAQIQTWLRTFRSQRLRVEIVRLEQPRPDLVESTQRISVEAFDRLGIPALEFVADAVVQDGKVKYYSISFTPESADRFRELQAQFPAAAQVGRVPAQLPRTGGAPIPAVAPLGLALLGAGLLLRAQRSPNRHGLSKKA